MLTNTEIIRALHYGMTVQCYTLRGYSKTLMTLGLGKGLTSHTVWHRAAAVRFLVPPESDGRQGTRDLIGKVEQKIEKY